MRNQILVTTLFILASCSPSNNTDRGIPNAEYNPCAIISDFIAKRVSFLEKPSKRKYNLNGNSFVFVDMKPIYQGTLTNENTTADTSIESFNKNKSYITSRIESPIHNRTLEAYEKAQNTSANYSDCELPSHVYPGDDGLKKIEEIIIFNAEQRLAFMEEMQFFRDTKKQDSKPKSKTERQKSQEQYRLQRLKVENKFAKRPYSLHKFSRMRVNKEDRQIIFYHENFCGSLCGRGAYVLMEYVNNNWVITGSALIWVS